MNFFFVPCKPLFINCLPPPIIFNFFKNILLSPQSSFKLDLYDLITSQWDSAFESNQIFCVSKFLLLTPLRLPNVMLFLKCNSTKGLLKMELDTNCQQAQSRFSSTCKVVFSPIFLFPNWKILMEWIFCCSITSIANLPIYRGNTKLEEVGGLCYIASQHKTFEPNL